VGYSLDFGFGRILAFGVGPGGMFIFGSLMIEQLMFVSTTLQILLSTVVSTTMIASLSKETIASAGALPFVESHFAFLGSRKSCYSLR
jgi:hypothetical protein